MKDTGNFQTILIAIFGISAVLGALGFAGLLPLPKSEGPEEISGNIEVWGTFPKEEIGSALELTFADNKKLDISYTEKSKNNLDKDLVEALASGTGPDIVLLPQDLILRYNDKIFPIPFTSLSLRDFRNRFVEEGELYLTKDGSFGAPLLIDPLVMYWNRDIFSANGVTQPPVFWDEVKSLSQKITDKDASGNISQSAVSLGEFNNITNAKEIITALILQKGNPIITTGEDGIISTLTLSYLGNVPSADTALSFYSQFSDPTKVTYTWNRALSPSQDFFVLGKSGMYLGFVSETKNIKKRNPRLNLDVAILPQNREDNIRVTFGNIYAASVLKTSGNINNAIKVIYTMASPSFLETLSENTGLPPARRDMLGKNPNDSFKDIFYNSAIISKGWLDPNPEETKIIFQQMTNDITSNRSNIGQAVSVADARLQQLLMK